MTVGEAARQVSAAIPRGLGPPLLAEYGLEVSAEQADAITSRVLSLNLYWIRSALRAFHPVHADQIFERLWDSLQQDWAVELGLSRSPSAVRREMEQHWAGYEHMVQEGRSPVMVMTEAISALESRGLVQAEDRDRVLAFFIDHVPVDTYGELLAELDLS